MSSPSPMIRLLSGLLAFSVQKKRSTPRLISGAHRPPRIARPSGKQSEREKVTIIFKDSSLFLHFSHSTSFSLCVHWNWRRKKWKRNSEKRASNPCKLSATLSFAIINASSVNILIASVTLLPWRRYAPSECF